MRSGLAEIVTRVAPDPSKQTLSFSNVSQGSGFSASPPVVLQLWVVYFYEEYSI